MPVEVKVGPQELSLHEGYTVLVTERDGQVRPPGQKGLYFLDTRVISSWELSVNGKAWLPLSAGTITYHAARILLTNSELNSEHGVVRKQTLKLALGRSVDGGIHEDIDLANFGREKVLLSLEIRIHGDFADIFEVRSGTIGTRPQVRREWSAEPPELAIRRDAPLGGYPP